MMPARMVATDCLTGHMVFKRRTEDKTKREDKCL